MKRVGCLPVFAVVAFMGALLAVRVAATHQEPDPNDPRQAGILVPDVLAANLQAASDVVNDRVARGEISDSDGQRMLAEYADSLSSTIVLKEIDQKDAWRYAEVFRTARRWDLAKAAYEYALSKPRGEGRRVTDTLRLAQCFAELGDVPTAIATARKVFDAKPADGAPILPGVYLEIIPSAKGKGNERELAKLVEDAVEIHAKVSVDRSTKEGITFLYARPYHVRKALQLAAQLYRSAGDEEAAKRALDRLSQLVVGNRMAG
ncbi:MAG: hypothetical protein U0S12_12920 [Fimbriimonadales bacterium]